MLLPKMIESISLGFREVFSGLHSVIWIGVVTAVESIDSEIDDAGAGELRCCMVEAPAAAFDSLDATCIVFDCSGWALLFCLFFGLVVLFFWVVVDNVSYWILILGVSGTVSFANCSICCFT